MISDDELTEFLRARLEEDERIAKAASGRDGETPGEPEEWHWECRTDDQPVDVDLAIASGEETLDHGEHYNMGLRSVQQYPTRSVGDLPHLVLGDEEVRPQDARHIARHDPARALREVEAKRRLLELAWDADQTDRILDEEIARKVSPGELTTGGLMIRAMAAVYSDHPDYRQEWKP